MKNLIFTGLLSLGLLAPVSLMAATNSSASKTEFSNKKPKKKKSKKNKRNRAKRSGYYSQSRNCTYNGYPLNVGSKGGCYYYSGNSKVYVDRAYCSGCN